MALPVFPANVPYCLEHSIIYPASRVRCEVDGADLSVRCPVDGTVRDASIQTCSGCGTRFVLGASGCARARPSARRARPRVAPRSPEAARHDTAHGMTLAKVSLYLFSIGAIGLVIAFVLDVVHTTLLAVGRRRAPVAARVA